MLHASLSDAGYRSVTFHPALAAFCGQVLSSGQECLQDRWPPARTALKYWSLEE